MRRKESKFPWVEEICENKNLQELKIEMKMFHFYCRSKFLNNKLNRRLTEQVLSYEMEKSSVAVSGFIKRVTIDI